MAKRLHQVIAKKKDKALSFKISVDPTKLPNKMHLDAQISYPARIHEDKRFKKLKHKGKLYPED